MARLRRVLFPGDQDNGCGALGIDREKANCSLPVQNDTKRRRSSSAYSDNGNRSVLEESCLAQLPVSDVSTTSQRRGIELKETKKRRREKRNRSSGIYKESGRNSQDENRCNNDRSKCVNDCRGGNVSGEEKMRRRSRVTNDGMDILGQISNFALNSLSMIGVHRGDKKNVRKRLRSNTNNEDNDIIRSSLEVRPSPSVPKPRKRLDVKSTPSQFKYECNQEESLENIIWNSLSSTSRKTRKKESNNVCNSSVTTSGGSVKSECCGDANTSAQSVVEDKIFNVVNITVAQTENISPQDDRHESGHNIENKPRSNIVHANDTNSTLRKRNPLADISSNNASLDKNDQLQSKMKTGSKKKLATPCIEVNDMNGLRRSSRCRRPVDRLVDAKPQQLTSMSTDVSDDTNDLRNKASTNECSVSSSVKSSLRKKKSVEKQAHHLQQTVKSGKMHSDNMTFVTSSKSKKVQYLDPDILPYSKYLASKGIYTKEKAITSKCQNDTRKVALNTNNETPQLGNDLTVLDQQRKNSFEWDELSVKQLLKAHKETDPKCVLFWHDIASKVYNKSADQCRDKWFSLVKTPKLRRKKTIQQATPPDQHNSDDYDDIFNSTPLRNASKLILSWGKASSRRKSRSSSDNFLDLLLSSSPVIKSKKSNESEKRSDTTKPSPLHFRKMTKCYVKKVRAGFIDLKTKKKPSYVKASKKNQQCLSEAIDAGDVHMNGFLSPNGTVTIDAPEEHEVQGYYIPSDNENEC